MTLSASDVTGEPDPDESKAPPSLKGGSKVAAPEWLTTAARVVLLGACVGCCVLAAAIYKAIPTLGIILGTVGGVVGTIVLVLMREKKAGSDGWLAAVTRVWDACRNRSHALLVIMGSVIALGFTGCLHAHTQKYTVQTGNASSVDVRFFGIWTDTLTISDSQSRLEADFNSIAPTLQIPLFAISCRYNDNQLFAPETTSPNLLRCPTYAGDDKFVRIDPPDEEDARLVGVPIATPSDQRGLRELHGVRVAHVPYYIQRREATWADLDLIPSGHVHEWSREHRGGRPGNMPVVGITFEISAEYCEQIGTRLPTEAEWEFAARTAGHLVAPKSERAEEQGGYKLENDTIRPVQTNVNDQIGVGQGILYDMMKNAQEWVGDPDWLPDGPVIDAGTLETLRRVYRIVRGIPLTAPGQPVAAAVPLAWRDTLSIGDTSSLRDEFRQQLNDALRSVGFRCATTTAPDTLLVRFKDDEATTP